MSEVIRCVVCDKPIHHPGPMVQMRTDGYLFSDDHTGQVPPSQDQGWWDIGPDCLKRVQKSGPAGLKAGWAR